MKYNRLFLKLLLSISVGVTVFYTTPAWFQGFFGAGVVSLALIILVWKISAVADAACKALKSPYAVFAGLVFCTAYGVNFYNMWLDSSYILRIAELLGFQTESLVLVLTLLFTLLAVPCVSCVFWYSADRVKKDYRGIQGKDVPETGTISMVKAFAVLCVIFIVGISAILRANFLYQDDAGRAVFGYKQWDYFGRFLSTAMATLIHGGDYLVDIAPLPQLAAMVIMAAAGVLLLYLFYERTTFSWLEVLSVVPLGLNPYFLECVSFRFDAPYMAVSVLGALLPLLFYRCKMLVYLFLSAVGVLTVCTSYQAATGIFPIAVILLALRKWNRGENVKEVIAFCLKSALGFLIGLVYFKAILMRPADAGYVSNAMPSVNAIVPIALGNLSQYYQMIATDFKPQWLVVLGLLVAAFAVVTVLSSKRKKILSCLITAIALVLMLILCFGLYPFLEKTLFAPRAMYGFGALIAMLAVSAAEGKKWIPAKFPALVLSWMFFVFAFTYGNALNYQREYTDYRVELVLSDLKDMEVFQSEAPVTVQISGSIGQAPILNNMPQNYQMLNRLIPETFSGASDLTQYRFFEYYDLRNVIADMGALLDGDALPLVKDTMYHTITADETRVVIHLK